MSKEIRFWVQKHACSFFSSRVLPRLASFASRVFRVFVASAGPRLVPGLLQFVSARPSIRPRLEKRVCQKRGETGDRVSENASGKRVSPRFFAHLPGKTPRLATAGAWRGDIRASVRGASQKKLRSQGLFFAVFPFAGAFLLSRRLVAVLWGHLLRRLWASRPFQCHSWMS